MRVIVAGVGGRMGRMLVRAVSSLESAKLVGATELPGSVWLGRDAGSLAGLSQLGVEITDNLDQCPEADAVIDFTAPGSTIETAKIVAGKGMRMVIGTTGFEPEALNGLKKILAGVPVVMAANYSVGVNLSLELIRRAAVVLGPDYDAEIFEAHHRHKVDAPSGTALAMGRSLAEGRGVVFADKAVYAREGITGAREPGTIGFSVVRGGNIVGEHKAMFIADEERVEINHIASDRKVFARGAVRAAGWLMDQKPGWYDMRDVLGFKD